MVGFAALTAILRGTSVVVCRLRRGDGNRLVRLEAEAG